MFLTTDGCSPRAVGAVPGTRTGDSGRRGDGCRARADAPPEPPPRAIELEAVVRRGSDPAAYFSTAHVRGSFASSTALPSTSRTARTDRISIDGAGLAGIIPVRSTEHRRAGGAFAHVVHPARRAARRARRRRGDARTRGYLFRDRHCRSR